MGIIHHPYTQGRPYPQHAPGLLAQYLDALPPTPMEPHSSSRILLAILPKKGTSNLCGISNDQSGASVTQRGSVPIQRICVLVCLECQPPHQSQITDEEDPAEPPRPREYEVEDHYRREEERRLPCVESAQGRTVSTDSISTRSSMSQGCQDVEAAPSSLSFARLPLPRPHPRDNAQLTSHNRSSSPESRV